MIAQMFVLLCLSVLFLLLRVVYCIYKIRSGRLQKPGRQGSETVKTMVVLGSGGHTMEMMCLTKGLDRARYSPLIYVKAHTDTTSEVRVRSREEEEKNIQNCLFISIPRSREVGQSYVSSLFTTLYALTYSIWLVYKTNPDLLLTNGPGTAIPLCFSAFFLQLLLGRETHIVFVESFCRVQSLSMTGKLVYLICSRFLVQWPNLVKKYPRCEHIPALC